MGKIWVVRWPTPPKLCSAKALDRTARSLDVPVTFIDHRAVRSGDERYKSMSSDFTAALFCPYVTAQIYFYEIYRMAIPIIMPSLRLSAQNEVQRQTQWMYQYAHVNATAQKASEMQYLRPVRESGVDETAKWLYDTDYYNGLYPHMLY